MEYCAKGDLLKYLRAHLETCKEAVYSVVDKLQQRSYANTNLSLKELISLIWQVADGMTYLSSKGFVHRDLAARNVLLTDELHAKISDFGLCRLSDSEIYEAHRGGKFPVRWTAIEALTSGNFSSASDMWSFGVLMFEIFSAGAVPYEELQTEDVLPFIKQGMRLEQPLLCPMDM